MDSISHSFRGILRGTRHKILSAGRRETYIVSLVTMMGKGGGREGKDRGHTSSVSEKNARGTVCPASHFRSAMSSFDFRRESTRLFFSLAKTSRDFRYISSLMISQSVSQSVAFVKSE